MLSKGVSMLKEPSSPYRGKSSAFILIRDVEDEEVESILLALGKLVSSPSILLTANQGYEG